MTEARRHATQQTTDQTVRTTDISDIEIRCAGGCGTVKKTITILTLLCGVYYFKTLAY